jgi:paraquat-inducible protein B
VSKRANPALIGGFVLGGVLLAVIAVVVFGSGRLFRDTETFISFFDGSVAGLEVGAPVRFRGIEIGAVTAVLIDLASAERAFGDARIPVIYEIDRDLVLGRGAAVRMGDPLDIDELLSIGVRAQLATESLVTGRKYIGIDVDPDAPVEYVPVPGVPYPEIPAVNTGLERIEVELQSIIADLGAVELDALVNVAIRALDGMAALTSSPELASAIEHLPVTLARLDAAAGDLQVLAVRMDSSLTPMSAGVQRTAEQATVTLRQLETTLHGVEGVLGDVDGALEPGSPHFVRFDQAMIDLSEASRALRNLADYLERNPGALLRGRPGGGP